MKKNKRRPILEFLEKIGSIFLPFFIWKYL